VTEQHQLWDRLPDEPAAAYARFLCYRNLGPMRSIEAAYAAYAAEAEAIPSRMGKAPKGPKKPSPGNWKADARQYRWRERAEAWDVHLFVEAGEQAVVEMVALVRALLRQVYGAMMQSRPKTWPEILESINVLREVIPQAAVTELYARHAARRAAGASGSGTPDAPAERLPG
jgi:hypothetical protein